MKVFILISIVASMAVIAWAVIKMFDRNSERLRQKSKRLEEAVRELNDKADDLMETLDAIDEELYP